MEQTEKLRSIAFWVESVIRSCKTLDQVRSASNLITNFENLAGKTYIDLICRLKYCLHNKVREVSSGIDMIRI